MKNEQHTPTNGEVLQTEEQLIEQELVNEVASELHEQWRADRLLDDGFYEPREKQTTDAAWIEERGTDVVDIANTKYEYLPADWQAENKQAAETVVALYGDLEAAGVNGNLDDDPELRSFVGDEIHKAWLSRNIWAKDGELGVPFDELPPEEQDKDLNQYVTLQAVLRQQGK